MSLPSIRTVGNACLRRGPLLLSSRVNRSWASHIRQQQQSLPSSALCHQQPPLGGPAYISIAPFSSATNDGSSSTASSSATSGSKGIRGWMKERQDRHQQERYIEQMERLSNMEVLNMENYREELKRGVSGFMAKLSFMQTREVKMAKDVLAVVEKIIDVLGPKATAEDLLAMDRFQRLQVATASNKTVEEISIMVSQITNMDVMQKALRKRKLDGKPIPPNQEAMQAVIRKDAIAVMSKPQKELLRSRQESLARKMAKSKKR